MNSKLMTVALTAVALFLVSNPAFAQDAAGAGKLGGIGMSAGLSVGLAAVGCGLAQGRATAAALEGIARNPQAADKIQTPMLIGLVFIETLVLFTFGFGFLAIS
ncbi:ATP synthase F0 subunit C [Myxococcota bacterium]|jgi:F-type H+-transporting ATPase subunit c|nr:ATP synthase F0 subunit C [Myxococcota bacterium]